MLSPEDFLSNAEEAYLFSVDIAWDQHRRYPELSRGTCLRCRSFLYTLLTAEGDFFGKACELADSAPNRRTMNSLLPELRILMTERFKHPVVSSDYAPGNSFRYTQTSGNLCYLHIRNAKIPESFLDDPVYVVKGLNAIMNQAESFHSCTVLYTATWLNAHNAFLHFFPKEWKENLRNTLDGEIGPTMGWQGQFINKRGLLNRATADYYLKNGVLLYQRLESHCSFTNMREHLKKIKTDMCILK